MAKKTIIGTHESDEFFMMNHLLNDALGDDAGEYDTDFEMPTLRPSKIRYFDLKKNGKMHPMTDQILQWQFKMEQAGKYDQIPNDPQEVIKLFETKQLP